MSLWKPTRCDAAPLPDEVSLAWYKADTIAGWMSHGRIADIYFRDGMRPHAGEFHGWSLGDRSLKKKNLLRKLPVPEVPFGLSFWLAHLEEHHVRDLAEMHTLHAIVYLGNAGLEHLGKLESLRFLHFDGVLTDDGLARLGPLKALQTLDLSGTHVTDGSMSALVRHSQLRNLDLSDIKGPGLRDLASLASLRALSPPFIALKYLAPLRQLRILDLRFHEGVTDSELEELAPLSRLRSLELQDTKVTKHGMAALARLKELRTLGLYGTPVDDAALHAMAAIGSLERLNLGETKITDAGLKELSRLDNLTHLDLESTPITDRGLLALAKVKSLQKVKACETQITEAGVQEMRRVRPDVMVLWSG